jgi:hypothetical protein
VNGKITTSWTDCMISAVNSTESIRTKSMKNRIMGGADSKPIRPVTPWSMVTMTLMVAAVAAITQIMFCQAAH